MDFFVDAESVDETASYPIASATHPIDNRQDRTARWRRRHGRARAAEGDCGLEERPEPPPRNERYAAQWQEDSADM